MYLGVPIFKGRPRSKFLQPLADKVILKLASWKGYLLCFAWRVELVKSSIQSMLIHSMSVYVWHVSLLRHIKKAARNFIWTGNVVISKVVNVAWKNICNPYSEGGFGTRSLIALNEASNLKLCWDFLN